MSINRVSSIAKEELAFLENNPNKGTERGHHHIRKSLEKFKFGRPILLGADDVPIAGNQTLEVALEMGLPVQVVESYGDVVIAHKRKDVVSTSPQALEMAIADNRSSEVGLAWDMDVLESAREAGLTDDWWFDEEFEYLDIETSGLGQTRETRSTEEELHTGEDPLDLKDDSAIKPGDSFILGEHRLTAGLSTKRGDVAVMIAAWERYTGHKAYRDDSFDEFMDVE